MILAQDIIFPTTAPSQYTFDLQQELNGGICDNNSFAHLDQTRYWLETKPAMTADFKINLIQQTKRGPETTFDTTATTTYESKEIIIRAHNTLSDPLDVLPTFASDNERVDTILLPVDLDIVHPAAGEVADGNEDSTSAFVEKGKGGLVAIRRNSDTPLTKLILRAIPSLPASSKFRLNVDLSLGSGHIKIWRDPACTQLVTSQQTEFDVGAETTLYVEGVDQGSGSDLKVIQEIKVGETWHQGDKVSIAVVHAEIELVLRCFIPHKWTSAEGPIPTQLFPPDASSTIAGDREDYSLRSHSLETRFRLSQMLVMTPYKELHSQVDIASKRDEIAAPLTEYYRKSEDIPAADQNADFGETLVVGATPNWSFAPDPNPSANYTDAHRSGDVSKITVSLSGGPGTAPFVPDGFTPNIDWEYTISMTRMEYGSNPYIRVEVDGNHNLYPAYEVIAQESDGFFVPLYQVKPLPSILPGPNSLNVTTEANGSPIDLD